MQKAGHRLPEDKGGGQEGPFFHHLEDMEWPMVPDSKGHSSPTQAMTKTHPKNLGNHCNGTRHCASSAWNQEPNRRPAFNKNNRSKTQGAGRNKKRTATPGRNNGNNTAVKNTASLKIGRIYG